MARVFELTRSNRSRVLCRTDFNECAANEEVNSKRPLGPCINAMACNNTPGGFQCQCQEGWGGQTCAKNLDDCAMGQCRHGGTCIDLVNDYHCACSPGYTGK